MDKEILDISIEQINVCVIIPTYNNQNTLVRVIESVREYMPDNRIIIVNDGATDSTSELLIPYESMVSVLKNEVNRGKGYSLRKAFKFANERGFSNAITIDSDGQHFAADIPKMIATAVEFPNTVLMGSRNMNQQGVPQKSSFGNKFSNFWFKIETWITLPDTQTGYRLYPLKPLKNMRLLTTKFELEIEVIVRLAWKNIPFKAVPIDVKYDPDERVSHFRPGRDFFRISVLNTFLVIGAILYYYPKKFLSTITWSAIKEEAIKPEETNFSKAISLGFGVFIGIVPIWGFQLLIGIPLAIFFKMNKVLFIAAANISFPPLIPFILYGSLLVGQFLTEGKVDHERILTFTMDAISSNLFQYLIGAFALAIGAFATVFTVSFGLLKLFRKEPIKSTLNQLDQN